MLRVISLSIVLLSLVVFSFLLAGTIHPANAAGETFTLNSTPQRINEGNSTGVSLTLSVANAMTSSTTYGFTWTVVDPSGSSKVATSSTVSTAPSWTISVKYPRDFAGTLNLTGTYNVNVAETLPTNNASITTGQFQVGLTDHPTYQRTLQVRTTGGGYLPADNVTLTLYHGLVPVPGFPVARTADLSGRVFYSWPTAPDTPVGIYTISLAGKNTPAKVPPDLQTFNVTSSTLTLASFSSDRSSLQRTQTVSIHFTAVYANGLGVTSGTGLVKFTEPDTITIHLVTATYDTASNSFQAPYLTSLSSAAGQWTADLELTSLNDGYGNTGPTLMSSTVFTVKSALLALTVDISNTPHLAGSLVPIFVTILTPAGNNYTSGTVIANVAYPNASLGKPFSLVYDQTGGEWAGSLTVNSTDPTGTWLVNVNASDIYGNRGGGSTSFNVNTSPPGPGSTGTKSPDIVTVITGLLPWIVLLVAVGLGFVTLIFRRYSVSHRQVKIDVEAIKTKANEVKSDDFLQSIQAQLKRRTERMNTEKTLGKENP